MSVMVALWKRMREYTGQGWVREYGDAGGEAFNAWTDALKDFSEDQIARGVKHCRDWRKDFPPNLGQFRELCLTVHQEEIKPWKPDKPLLQHLRGSAQSEVARREFAKMDAIAAGKSEYEWEGEMHPLPTFEECYNGLGLNLWWGHLNEAQF